jgi:hypothetical protein
MAPVHRQPIEDLSPSIIAIAWAEAAFRHLEGLALYTGRAALDTRCLADE